MRNETTETLCSAQATRFLFTVHEMHQNQNKNQNQNQNQTCEKLRQASRDGRHDACAKLLESGATGASGYGENGATPLHDAARQGHVGICRLIVKYETDVLCLDSNGNGALHLSCLHGHYHVCDFLLSQGGVPSGVLNARGQTPLQFAAAQGHLRICRLLIVRGASATTKDVRGRTPLHDAIGQWGTTDVCCLLVHHDADVDSEDEQGLTPLDVAKAKGRTDIVHVLSPQRHSPQQCAHIHSSAY